MFSPGMVIAHFAGAPNSLLMHTNARHHFMSLVLKVVINLTSITLTPD